MRCRAFRNRFPTRFARRDDGAATIEAVLWIPFFIMLFLLIADVSMIFHGQSKLLRIAQDANRNMSINRLTTTDEVQSFVETQVRTFSKDPRATTTVVAGLITTTVSVPMTDLDLFGVSEIFRGVRMTVRAQHLMES